MATEEETHAVNEGGRGVATVLAIGTANPLNCVMQVDYPDYYFRITDSQHKIELKEKFKRICEKTMIKKRYMHLTEEILKENPNFCAHDAPSLDARIDMKVVEMPKLAEKAATAAIEEWGQAKSNITHIVFHSTSGVEMPGADYQLIRSLGLKPSVKRVMLYHQGCFAGGTTLRIAKDLAENNPGSRVLVVCSEMTITTFRGPFEEDIVDLIAQAVFGDGAAAVIIGADGENGLSYGERPLYRLISSLQTILPESEDALGGRLREVGLTLICQTDKLPKLIGENIETCLVDAFRPFGISNWNSLFWVPHPGGSSILQEIEERVGLEKEKLRAAWHVVSEYGNMSSATVFFVLNEMRKRSLQEGKSTTGEGLKWGVLFGFGPGFTVETVVLQGVPIVGLF